MKNWILKDVTGKYLIVELGKEHKKIEDYLTDDINKAARFGLLSSLEQMRKWYINRELDQNCATTENLLKMIFMRGSIVEVEDPDTPEFLERVRKYEKDTSIKQVEA